MDSGENSEVDERSYTPILTISDHDPGSKNLNSFTEKQVLFNDLVRIFAKPKPERTSEEALKAMEALKTVPLFKKFLKKDSKNNEVFMNIYEAMNYEVVNKDEAIFHFAEKGSKVYLVLKGSVDIFIPKDKDEILNDVMNQRSNRERENTIREGVRSAERKTSLKPERSTSRSRRDSMYAEGGRRHSIFRPEKIIKTLNNTQEGSISQNRINTNSSGPHYPANHEIFSKFTSHQELYFEENVLKFKKLKSVSSGSYFGEIGLTSDVPRDITAIAGSNVHLISLTKWAYEKNSDLIQEKMKSKWDFFTELLQEESKEILKRFCSSFREEKRKYGQKIIQQGSMPKEVYVICQGEVQIIRHDVEKEAENETAKFFVEDKRKKKVVNKRVVNLGRFAFVGEGEATLGQPYNMTALSLSNNTILYTTTVEEYAKLKRAYPYTFNNIDQAYQAKAAFWDKRISNLSQTQEKIQGELATPPRRSKSPMTGFLRSEIEVPDRASPGSEKLVKRHQLVIQDNAINSPNIASPYRDNNTPGQQQKNSKAFTFDSVYNDLQELHEDSFREKRFMKYSKNQRIRKTSSAVMKTGENTHFTDENDDTTKKSHSKSKFSALHDRFEIESIITPKRQSSALEKLFKEKLFQNSNKEQPPSRNITSAKSVRSSKSTKSVQSGNTLRYDIDSSSNNKRIKEAYVSLGSATKVEAGSFNDSRRDTSFLQFIDEKKHLRKSSFLNAKNLPTNPDDVKSTLENEIMTAATRKPDIKLEDQSSPNRFLKLSKNHSSVSEGYFLNPRAKSRGFQSTDLASLELGSPFSKKKVELSLTLNNFNVNRNHIASTKAEKIIEAIWPNSPLQAVFQKTESTWTSEKVLKPFQHNKTIIASKHNLFRLKPAKAHLAVNYSATGLTFKEGGRIKKY